MNKHTKRTHSTPLPLRATFLGAAGEVTGSCTLLDFAGTSVLVDCGMLQSHGAHERQTTRLIFRPPRVRAVLLTHAHLDHSGLLPWLCKQGFAGPIFATPGTRDLCQILLADSAELQVEDAAYHRRKGMGQVEPLYTPDDIVETMAHFVAIDYRSPFEPLPGLEVEFFDAGHILGAASILLRTGNAKEIVFSGDIGPGGHPIIRDPDPPPAAETVITEATYGDRRHPPIEQAVDELAEAVNSAVELGGVVLMPVFAVGRAQSMLFELGQLMRAGRIPRMPIFLDSPLAIEAVEVFQRHREYFDRETNALIAQGIKPLQFREVCFCRTVADSKKLNDLRGPAVIMAGSGMCTGGRIRHHLRNRLSNPRDTVVFVGYQARGTLGRILLEGAERVKLFGEWIPVRARITKISGFSAHADADGLLHWLSQIRDTRRVIINHAEPEAAQAYAETIRSELGLKVSIAQLFETVSF